MSRILVAMSGGVDSSVAAALLKDRGHDVLGVHMKLHDEVTEVVPKSCCGQKDALDAREVCDEIGIPYFVTDYREHFKKYVINNFVSEYQNGRTPIPCTHCNGILKFDLLLRLAEAMNYEYVATGHYAKLDNGMLYAANDLTKDQSYFLFPIKKEHRHKVIFPLGDLTKNQVRGLAAWYDLPVADKQESQNLCFAPGGTHKQFLEKLITPRLGRVIHEDGTDLGAHSGIHNFTLGQRRGLGVNYQNKTLFVTRIIDTTVYVSDIKNVNEVLSFKLSGYTSWTTEYSDLTVVTRYHKTPQLVESLTINGDQATIHLADASVVTPGQAAVLYNRSAIKGHIHYQVIGGGWIN